MTGLLISVSDEESDDQKPLIILGLNFLSSFLLDTEGLISAVALLAFSFSPSLSE
jgi:hypothetical protein